MSHNSDFIILNVSKENKFDDHVANSCYLFHATVEYIPPAPDLEQ